MSLNGLLRKREKGKGVEGKGCGDEVEGLEVREVEGGRGVRWVREREGEGRRGGHCSRANFCKTPLRFLFGSTAFTKS